MGPTTLLFLSILYLTPLLASALISFPITTHPYTPMVYSLLLFWCESLVWNSGISFFTPSLFFYSFSFCLYTIYFSFPFRQGLRGEEPDKWVNLVNPGMSYLPVPILYDFSFASKPVAIPYPLTVDSCHYIFHYRLVVKIYIHFMTHPLKYGILPKNPQVNS